MSTRTKAELLLVAATFFWGTTFVVVKGALSDAAPLPFLAVRFLLAGILLYVVMGRGRVDREALRAGGILGFFLFGGYLFQTLGLEYTTPSKSAFLTASGVILVPLLLLMTGQGVRAASLFGAALGFAGIYLLAAPPRLTSVNRGDVLTLLCAVSFALHVIFVNFYTRRFSYTHLVPAQILTVGILATGSLALGTEQRLHLSGRLVFAWLVTALLATCFGFTAQNWAQQYTPPSHAALIFALEPVFAALTSWLLVKERFGPRALLGSGFVLAGMVVSELKLRTTPLPPLPIEG